MSKNPTTREFLQNLFLNTMLPMHHDSGHGWLEVPQFLLPVLGIKNHISRYSYQRDDKVFLEEDLDLSTFFEAIKYHNIPHPLFHTVSNTDRSEIRLYDDYKPINPSNEYPLNPTAGLQDSLVLAGKQLDAPWEETLAEIKSQIQAANSKIISNSYQHTIGIVSEVQDDTITIICDREPTFQVPKPSANIVVGDRLFLNFNMSFSDYEKMTEEKDLIVIDANSDLKYTLTPAESADELRQRIGPYPANLHPIFEGNKYEAIINRMEENNLLHMRTRQPHEDTETLHYALVRGAVNCNSRSVDAFFQELVNGKLEEDGQTKMNFDLNTYPDANITLAAAHMGAYTRMDPDKTKASAYFPPHYFRQTVKNIAIDGDYESNPIITLTLKSERERKTTKMVLKGQEAQDFLTTGCKANDILDTLVFSNNSLEPQNTTLPLYVIRDGYNNDVRAIRRLEEKSNIKPKTISGPTP